MAAEQNSPVTSYTAPPASNTTTAAAFRDGAPLPENLDPYVDVSATPYSYDPSIFQRCANCICYCICSAFLLAIIIIGTVLLSAFIPHSTNPCFRLDTLTLSNFNMSSNSNSIISGTTWDARFTVSNPNSKAVLHYDRIKVFVSYHSKLISETTVLPFMQGKKNQTTLSATFVTQPVYQYVNYRNGINSEKASGIFHFNLRMRVRVRFQASQLWYRGRRNLEIYCQRMPVRVSTNSKAGSLVGGSKHCGVRL